MTLLCARPPAARLEEEGDPGGTKTGDAQTHKWKAGIVVTAVGGPCKSIVGYVPVPIEWPEQTVKVVEQEISPGVKVSYQTLDETAKLMVLHIAFIAAGEQAKAVMTFEVNRSMQLAPDDKTAFVLPAAKDLTPALRRYLAASPKIEIQNPKILKAAKETGADAKLAWDRVEALYDWTRTQVKYKTGDPVKGRRGRPQGRFRRSRRHDLAVRGPLPRGRHPRPHRLGAGILLRRVLPAGQDRRRPLDALLAGRGQGLRRDARHQARAGQGRQLPPALWQQGAQRYIKEYLTGARRRPRRRPAQRAVHPRR